MLFINVLEARRLLCCIVVTVVRISLWEWGPDCLPSLVKNWCETLPGLRHLRANTVTMQVVRAVPSVPYALDHCQQPLIMWCENFRGPIASALASFVLLK